MLSRYASTQVRKSYWDTVHTREAALAAGMEAFLEKPVTLDALATALTGGPVKSAELEVTPDRDSVFARLRGPAVAARTRALLAAEWPAGRNAAAAALASGKFTVLGSLAHRLQSSALLMRSAFCKPFRSCAKRGQ